MGVAMSWIAIKGLDRSEILIRMRLKPNGAVGDFLGGKIGVQELPDGWTLIVIGDVLHPLASRKALEQTSAGCTILTCNIEEHVMFSRAEAWEDGKRLWYVEHEGDSDARGLEVQGKLPANYAALERDHRESQQADDAADPGVDHIFDVPLALAASIVGYKHDESPIDKFELLDWQKPIKPWWQFW
jgi:hypothetical protein